MMILGDVFKRFAWRDRDGLIWDVSVAESIRQVSWHAESRRGSGIGEASVQIREVEFPDLETRVHMPIAHIVDLRVSDYMQNRGVGSMLVRQAVDECKRRGHLGIDGDLSREDQSHFDRLERFYEKMGFSVEFYHADDPANDGTIVGGIKTMF